MTFFVNCSPPRSLSKNSKRVYNGHVVENPKAKGAKADIVSLFQKYAPNTPYLGPVRLVLTFFYPYPAQTAKKVLSSGGRPMVKTPDVDGIASGVMDCMTTLRFWLDDKQVYCLHVEKWEVPDNCGIRVEIEEKI